MKPRDAKTFKDVFKLKQEVLDYKHFWFLVGPNRVTLCEQTNGEPAKAMITIPRSLFIKIVDWYNKEQK